MDVALFGYGQMGRQVEEVLGERNHRVTARIDPVTGDTDAASFADKAEIVIEFSLPDAVVDNASLYANAGINAVVGTTGWYGEVDKVKAIVEKAGTGFLYASNFSVGAHLFFKIVKAAASLVNAYPDFDIMAYEWHHKRKKDSPSGTAHTLAQIMMSQIDRKETLATEKLDRPVDEKELHFASIRGGFAPGVHRIMIDSDADTIELVHTARNRKGLALGAVLAAEWLVDRKGFYDMEAFVRDVLKLS
jgi:4-hydroxy-tetrahydrodipicolinate reductase